MAHNTLRVDNLDQAGPEGPFAWSSIPTVKAESWPNAQPFDLFVGSHDGYRRLPEPVRHRRFVFHVKGGLWFVQDAVEGRGSNLLEILWHFAPALAVRENRGIVLAESSSDTATPQASLALLSDRNSAWNLDIANGFVSSSYGSKQVAPIMRLSLNATMPQDCGVLLLPMARASDVGTFSTIGSFASTARNIATIKIASGACSTCSCGTEYVWKWSLRNSQDRLATLNRCPWRKYTSRSELVRMTYGLSLK